MEMDFTPDRRRFLELAGVSTTFSLAGCSSSQNVGEQTEATTGDIDPTTSLQAETDQPTQTRRDPEDAPTVTMALEIDREALRERQSELQSQLQNGTINRTQAQQQFRSFRMDLIADAVDAFMERVENDPSMTVEDSVSQAGVLLVSGSPVSLIDSLSGNSVRGLFPANAFQQAKAQAQTGSN